MFDILNYHGLIFTYSLWEQTVHNVLFQFTAHITRKLEVEKQVDELSISQALLPDLAAVLEVKFPILTDSLREEKKLINCPDPCLLQIKNGVSPKNCESQRDWMIYSCIVFSGNQVSAALYLNLGELKFREVTQASAVATKGWLTGVSIADVNGDGWEDVYFGVGGADCNGQCENLLFINQGNNEEGIPTFKEKATEYGLNNGYYTQQTVFFDVDRDGDLDAYVLQNGNLKFDKNSPVPARYFPEHLGDYLLRNDWDTEKDHPVFTAEPTWDRKHAKGFGLGVAIEDLDDNGWSDLYAANDFISNDRLFLNKGRKEVPIDLVESSKKLTTHQTYNAMGVDIADVNNDLRPDILVLDMLPFEYQRQKKMMGSMNYEKFLLALNNDYTPQYVRNTLQIHNGTNNGILNPFSEVAFLSGIAKTDWSWAPLMFDADMDGDKDIFITNGYGKDITDLDLCAAEQYVRFQGRTR